MAPNGPPAPSRMRSAESRTACRISSRCRSGSMRSVDLAAAHETALAADEEIGGNGSGDGGRLLAFDLGQPDRTDKPVERRGRNAGVVQPLAETCTLRLRADQPE